MKDEIIKVSPSRKHHLAIFDFDWTIVKPKEGRKFPKDVADWQWLRPSVPEIITRLAKYHQIVIVTDQSKPWKVDQIKEVVSQLPINTIIIGVETQKPSIELFKKAYLKFHPEKAFYVGDAAGGEGVWSDKDRRFAEALGIAFKTPEEMFPLAKITTPKGLESEQKEVVIMVGYPASGKSTIAASLKGYHRVDGDALKTAAAMKRDAEKHVADSSIVFDSTAGTKEKRGEFVNFAKKHELPVRVFWVKTPIDEAMERNKQRVSEGGTKIPDVVFYVYRKKFEEPTAAEGFAEIVKL